MDALHVILAFAAGGGLFLSWGYRTALHVALGKKGASGQRPPRDPDEPLSGVGRASAAVKDIRDRYPEQVR